jgi:hypothetical protein
LKIDDVTGSNNSGYGLDLSAAEFTTGSIGKVAAVTLTGALGDILFAGGVIKTFASLTTDFWQDAAGNVLQGTAGMTITRITAGTMGNFPILAADPASPVNGDVWIKDAGGVRTLHARIAGATYTLTFAP